MSSLQLSFKFTGAEFMKRSAARTTIGTLFFSCRPFTIIRSIWTVVVNAIEAMIRRRAFANISKEIFEAFPLIANFDAATAVVFISWVVLVITALAHIRPNTVEGMTFLSIITVFNFIFFTVKAQTSARVGVAISKLAANGG